MYRSRNPPEIPRDWSQQALVKQTYSVWVETERGPRKWHLTAYFTQASVDYLDTIDRIPGVGELIVPDGLFRSTRVPKRKPDEQQSAKRTVPSPVKPPPPSTTRTYAPYPPTDNSPPAGPSMEMFQPYQYSPSPLNGYYQSIPSPPSHQYSPSPLPYYPHSSSHTDAYFSHQSFGGLVQSQNYPDYRRPMDMSQPAVGYASPLEVEDSHQRAQYASANPETISFPSENSYPSSSVMPFAHGSYHGDPSRSPSQSVWYGSLTAPNNALTSTGQHHFSHSSLSSDPSPYMQSHQTYYASSPSLSYYPQPIPNYSDGAGVPVSPTYNANLRPSQSPPHLDYQDSPSIVSNASSSSPLFLSIPPLQLPENTISIYENGTVSDSDSTGDGAAGLAPISSLLRAQRYPRDPLDEKTLRSLRPDT